MALHMNGIFRGRRSQDIVHRWEGNPLIGITDLRFKASDIHNAGLVEFEDKLLLLVTIEDLAGRRSIHLARSADEGQFVVDAQPLLWPSMDPRYRRHESGGVLDARATFLDGVYYIMYTALGDHGYRLGLGRTTDFDQVERIGLISEPDTKAGVLFPRKIGGRYAAMQRPDSIGGSENIWIDY